MKYKIAFEGDLNRLDDFCGALDALLMESLIAGILALDGNDEYSLRQHQLAEAKKDLEDACRKGDAAVLKAAIHNFYAHSREQSDITQKCAYYLGHRDSMRIQNMLWPREMPPTEID